MRDRICLVRAFRRVAHHNHHTKLAHKLQASVAKGQNGKDFIILRDKLREAHVNGTSRLSENKHATALEVPKYRPSSIHST